MGKRKGELSQIRNDSLASLGFDFGRMEEAWDGYLSLENAIRKQDFSEIASKFNNISKEDVKLLSEGATEGAKIFRNAFARIYSAYKKYSSTQITSATIISSLEKEDAVEIFKFFKKAAETKLLDKLEMLVPKAYQKSEEFKVLKEFAEQIKQKQTSGELKSFLISHLKDSKNQKMLESLTKELRISLETPKIMELVDLVTDPKTIKAASILVNSRASRNFAKVIAKDNPSKLELCMANVRLFATAIRLIPVSKIIKVSSIMRDHDARLKHEAEHEVKRIFVKEAISKFNLSVSASDSLIKATGPSLGKSSRYHRA